MLAGVGGDVESLQPAASGRALELEGSSYQKLLVETRRSLAEHYLSRSHISFAEVAYLLGFEDGNTFHRAFKSWAGITPGVYRSQWAGNVIYS